MKNINNIFGMTTLVAAVFVSWSSLANAQESSHEKMSADEVAKELANPNTNLGFLAFQMDYVRYQGDLPNADGQSGYKLNFQPSLPYSLGDGTNFFLRPLIPVFSSQPVPVGPGEFEQSDVELGDISLDAAIGKTMSNGVILVGGVVATLDTATDDALGLGQYLAGPEVLIGKGSSWGFYGLLLTHQWDIGGDDDFDTSITGGQYFFTYNLKNAWQIQMQPTFSYNHEAESGDRWTFPLGIGVSKTIKVGNMPLKLSVQYWQYVEQADAFGPDYQIRFQIAPVVPLPW
ncbi:hypothetical protein [Colwellia sp. MEBiC06753]